MTLQLKTDVDRFIVRFRCKILCVMCSVLNVKYTGQHGESDFFLLLLLKKGGDFANTSILPISKSLPNL